MKGPGGCRAGLQAESLVLPAVASVVGEAVTVSAFGLCVSFFFS